MRAPDDTITTFDVPGQAPVRAKARSEESTPVQFSTALWFYVREEGAFATQCPAGDFADCSTVPRCDETNEANCRVTVIDHFTTSPLHHFTTSFNFTETNFAALWLRPQWYLFSNSAITDVQNGGITFVTGGGYTASDVIPGHWAIARNDVFVGNTQPANGNPYAENAGPSNPDTLKINPNFTCAKQRGAATGQYCLNVDAGITMLLSNFGLNQRLFSIYDGPAYEENNAGTERDNLGIYHETPSGQAVIS